MSFVGAMALSSMARISSPSNALGMPPPGVEIHTHRYQGVRQFVKAVRGRPVAPKVTSSFLRRPGEPRYFQCEACGSKLVRSQLGNVACIKWQKR